MKKVLFISILISITFFALRVEASGKGNGKLKPIVRDNFDDYTLGILEGQSGWIEYVNGSNFIVQNSNSLRGNAVYNNSLGDSVITKFGQTLSDGRQKVYVKTENRSDWGVYPNGNAQVRVSKGNWSVITNVFAAVSFKSDGNVAYYDPVTDSYQNFDIYNDNEWTLLEIEWRSLDKTARYRVNNRAWTDWKIFNNNSSFTDFDNVGFDFVLPNGSGGMYFDVLK